MLPRTYSFSRKIVIGISVFVALLLFAGAALALCVSPEGYGHLLSDSWSRGLPRGIESVRTTLEQAGVLRTPSVTAGDVSKTKQRPPKDKPPADSEEPTAPVPPDAPPVPSDPPVPPAAPGAVSEVVCTSGDMADTITFLPPADGGPVDAYVLSAATSAGGPFSPVASVAAQERRFVVSVDTTGTPYYRIAASGPGGQGPLSGAVTNEHVSIAKEVSPSGATLRASNGEVALVLPAGAYETTTTVTIEEIDGSPAGGLISLAGVYQVEPSGPLGAPATLSVAYSLAVTHFQVRATILSEAKIMVYDPASASWAAAADTTEKDGMLSGQLSHFCALCAGAISPHGTSASAYCADAGICHNLNAYPDSATRLTARDSLVCYHCHGGTDPAKPDGATGENVQTSLSGAMSAHPLPTGSPWAIGTLYCTFCHDPHADPNQSPGLLRAITSSGTYVQGADGSSAGNAFCWACHGTVGNRRTAYLVPGYWADSGGDHQTGYAASAHAGIGGAATLSCTAACHQPHGAQSTTLLPARQYSTCTGATGQACHSDPANAAGGSNILADLQTGGTNDLTHHDVDPAAQARSGARLECTSCHNVHRNSASQPISNPDDPATSLEIGFQDGVVGDDGSLYVLVGAEHDGVAPVISGITRSCGGSDYTQPLIAWNTDEPATSWIDWGTSTSYELGNATSGAPFGSGSLVTSHSVRMTGLVPGVTYHYRIRTADALGNIRYSADAAYRPVQPPSTPTAVAVAPDPYPSDGISAIAVPLSWSVVTCPDGHAVAYRITITGVIADWDSTPYATTWTTSATSATTPPLTDGTYTWTVTAYDAVDTQAESQPSAGDTFQVTNAPNSCPFLFTWNGERFGFEVDLYDAGKLGVPTPTGTLQPSPKDYYVLTEKPVARNGGLELRVVGERWETDYLDAVGLYAVDVPEGRDLLAESADYGKTLGGLEESVHTVGETVRPPLSAVHVNTGEDVLGALAAADGTYVHLNEDNNVFEYQTLEIDLGDFGDASQVKLVVDHSVVFPNSAEGIALRQTFGPRDRLEVIGTDGQWVQVPTSIAGVPKPGEFPRTDVVDITGIFPTSDHRIRMTYLFESYIDRVAVDLTTDTPVVVTPVALQSAVLGSHGIDDVTSGDPYEYVYGAPNARSAYFNGSFTKYGSVDPLLGNADDMFVIFGGGDEIVLRFDEADAPAPGMKRFYVLYSHGYYKGTTTGLEPTVAPLPYAGMSAYPYRFPEHYPDDAEHLLYQLVWNTRVESAPAEPVAPLAWKFAPSLMTQPASASTATSAEALDMTYAGFEPVGQFSVDSDYAAIEVGYASGATGYVNATGVWETNTATLATRPTPGSPGTEVSAERRSALSADDGSYLRTDLTTSDRQVNWQVIKFDLSGLSSSPRQVTLRWTGHGEPTSGYKTVVAVWDSATSAWREIHNASSGSDVSVMRNYNVSTSVFCLRCHDGSAPAGVTMPASVLNVQSTWATGDFHGGRSGTGFGGGLSGAYVRGNPAIECGVCHVSHGNGNLYHIAGSVNGTNGIVVTNGSQMTNLCAACHTGTVDTWHGPCLGCHNNATAYCGTNTPLDSPEAAGFGGYPNASSDCTLCHNHTSKSYVNSVGGYGVFDGDTWPVGGLCGGPYGCHNYRTTF